MQKKIIVRMPNWIGDFVMGMPVLRDLASACPDVEVTALCATHLVPLLKHCPDVDRVLGFSRDRRFAPTTSLGDSLIQTIRNERYHAGILLTNSFSSAFHFYCAGVKQRIGFDTHARRMLLNCSVAYPSESKQQHLIKTYKELLQPLGIPLSATSPQLYITDEELEDMRGKIPSGRPCIGINPGAAYGSAKCWLPDRFRGVTEALLEKYTEGTVLFFGDVHTQPLVDQICRYFETSRVVNLAGRTSLRELMACIRLCDVLLTNDSGPMHIGAALGVPLIALFGSTSEVVTGPQGEASSVINKSVSCSPCFKKTCPIDFRCMKQITKEEVVNAIDRTLSYSQCSKNLL